jgi:hypothetical protein
VNADQPVWLTGMTEMTRTFGLELLEAVLTSFPQIFLQVIVDLSPLTCELECFACYGVVLSDDTLQ